MLKFPRATSADDVQMFVLTQFKYLNSFESKEQVLISCLAEAECCMLDAKVSRTTHNTVHM